MEPKASEIPAEWGLVGESDYQRIKSDLAAAARRWQRRNCQDDLNAAVPPERSGDREVSVETGASLDLLVRSLLAMGATRRDIALEIVRRA